ncbi:unnamed protein product [Sphagnum balticum]
MFGANLIVLLAVMRYKALRLRKEYVLVAAVSLANGLSGAAYFYAGVYRTYINQERVYALCISAGAFMPGLIEYVVTWSVELTNVYPVQTYVFDKNGDGVIGIEDIVALAKHFDERLSEEEMIDMLDVIDNNFDGRVTFEGQFADDFLL